MTPNPTSYGELLVLLALLIGPLAVDLALLFISLWCAKTGSFLLILAPAVLYLVLNVAGPLWVSFTFFRDNLGWLIALFFLVKSMEFGLFKVGGMYFDIFIEAWQRSAQRRAAR